MTKRSTLPHLAAASLLLAASAAMAQVPSAEDFAKRPEAWEVSLSPDGKHVAITVPSENGLETQLQIVELATGKTRALRFGKQQHVTGIDWSSDTQLVVERAQVIPPKVRPYSTGELYTTDVEGKNRDILFGWIHEDIVFGSRRKDQGVSRVVKVIDNEPGMVLVSFRCWDCGEEPNTTIFKVNSLTGSRQQIESGDKLATYYFDNTGEPRLRVQLDNSDYPILAYRPHKGDSWKPLPKPLAGYYIYEAELAPDNNTAYALISDGMEPRQAYKIDLANGQRTKLAGRDDVEVAEFLFEGRTKVPFGVYYNADKPFVQYLDPNSQWAQLHSGLMGAFRGQMISFEDTSRDGSKILFKVFSDRAGDSYYLYDRDTKKVQKILDTIPWLKPEQMAATRPFSFTGPGGGKIYGFITSKDTSTGPMVVVPHGGPFEVQDTWGYDPDVQFLANRGYRVLQVNYRGSSGRGEGFEQSGWKGWGTKIQDDITAAVKWAVNNKIADPGRICMYGASFGGYSALMQPILQPGMYKCAIGYVGVYDLPLWRETKDRQGVTDRTNRFFDRTLGADEAELAKYSPARRAAEVKVPVMLVHGQDDTTASLNQFKKMDAALRTAGNSADSMVVTNEGHGFVKPENIAKLYNRLAEFLDKYIGPDAK